MDLEMVFNELSLRVIADNIQTAQQRVSDLVTTARKAAEMGMKPIIRTNTQFYAASLAQNYSLLGPGKIIIGYVGLKIQ